MLSWDKGKANQGPPTRVGFSAALDNWRLPSRAPNKVNGSVFSSNPSGKTTIIPKRDIKPGVIIRAPVHQQDYKGVSQESEVTAYPGKIADQHVTPSRYGDIYTKVRKMIVVGVFEQHFTAVPLFTHNGSGLQNKRRPEEYISVRDHRSSRRFRPLSDNGTLETKILSSNVDLYHPATTAHITYPVSRPYNVEATPEGELDAESTRTLLKLVDRMSPKPKHR